LDEVVGRNTPLEPLVAFCVGSLLEQIARNTGASDAAEPAPTVTARFGLLSSSIATAR